MAEQIVLDPSEVATSRTAFDITPWVKADGIDWGDAAITAYMAQSQRGELPVDYRIPNRTVTIPLSVRNVGGTTFHTARGLVQSKAAMFQTEGGWLKRVASSGGTAYLDVVNATLHLGGGWDQAYKDFDVAATLTLEATPDFYGNEVDLGDNTSTDSYVVFTETGITGNYPARCRIVVDDDATVSRLGLIWAVRSKNYNSSGRAGIRHTAAEMTAMATTVGMNWTPLYSTDRDSAPTGTLLHQGTYRVWIGVTAFSTTEFRLVWDVGDMTSPVENPPASAGNAGTSGTYMLDLGEVRLDPPPSGTHQWKGIIQARQTLAPGGTPTVREMWVVPVDEGYGVLRAAPATSDIGMATYSANDEFNQAAGVLTGKTLPTGGTWADSGSGDAVDFSVTGAGYAQRTELSDATFPAGARRVYANGVTSMTNTVVQVDLWVNSILGSAVAPYQGVIARRSAATTYLFAAVFMGAAPDGLVTVEQNVAGVNTDLAQYVVPGGVQAQQFYTLRLYVNAAGTVQVWFFPQGSAARDPVMEVQSTDLATGGSLASGAPGLFDHMEFGTALSRRYYNWVAWAPPTDAVIFSGQSAELRTEGMFREDSAGAVYGPLADVVGDLPRLPPATIEARTCELFVNTSRGDFDQLPDATRTDDISVRAFYRPSWLTVPGS